MAERAASGSSSRAAFVQTTAMLLRRQGYAATGLAEIVARSGAPRGSLYFHFPGGKEELAVAALTSAGEQLRLGIEAMLDSRATLDEALALLLDALAAGLVASGYADGCPLATVALEAAAASEPLREAAAGAFAGWLAALARRIEAAGLDADAAARRATLVLAAIEGALILARARRDPAPLQHVRDELVALAGG
jgi:TetR/AcrR family transcriptional regulator, lmrAB and yxaGH operons repressor